LELAEVFDSYSGNEQELISILQDVQERFGYLPEEAMLEISRFLGIPESRVYAVASFYAQFRFTPMGKNIVMCCRGTACHVKGAPRILDEVKRELGIDEGETTEDLEYTLETVACIGCCALAPCLMIMERVMGRWKESHPYRHRNLRSIGRISRGFEGIRGASFRKRH
jgi:NADH-quinone oxidoreductase subunit E